LATFFFLRSITVALSIRRLKNRLSLHQITNDWLVLFWNYLTALIFSGCGWFEEENSPWKLCLLLCQLCSDRCPIQFFFHSVGNWETSTPLLSIFDKNSNAPGTKSALWIAVRTSIHVFLRVLGFLVGNLKWPFKDEFIPILFHSSVHHNRPMGFSVSYFCVESHSISSFFADIA